MNNFLYYVNGYGWSGVAGLATGCLIQLSEVMLFDFVLGAVTVFLLVQAYKLGRLLDVLKEAGL